MSNLPMSQLLDKLGVVLWFLLPAIVVLVIKEKRGIILGGIIFWLIGITIGILLTQLDPQREGGLIDSIFLFTGWLAGLIYASLIFLLKQSFLFLYQRFRVPRLL
jgi:hypothetical protein